MYPMGNIAVKPDFRLSMSSNPRPHQKQGGQKLSELVKQSSPTRQNKTFELAHSSCKSLRAAHHAGLFACALADPMETIATVCCSCAQLSIMEFAKAPSSWP